MRDRNNLFGVPFGNEEAATETPFFQRADMMDTKVGTVKKDDPADIAKDGFEAMMKGALSAAQEQGRNSTKPSATRKTAASKSR
ncbi:MAG: hypothetical protein WAV02_06715 [Stellaceae bacterium]